MIIKNEEEVEIEEEVTEGMIGRENAERKEKIKKSRYSSDHQRIIREEKANYLNKRMKNKDRGRRWKLRKRYIEKNIEKIRAEKMNVEKE